MEKVKHKKSSFEKDVIVFNIIAIIFMIYMIKSSLFMRGELSDTYGPPSIEEMQQDTFNAKFTTYEGIRTGSQIKQLIEIVNKSNLEYEGTDLIVCINGNIGDNQYIFKGESDKKYQVIIEKTDGFVSNIIINDIEKEVDNYEINNNYTNTENNINKSNTQKTYNIDYESGLIEICIWIPFIVINIVVYCKYKSNTKKMNTNLYDEEEIKRKQKSLLLLLLFAGIVSCLVSFFGLIYLESSIIHFYSCI